jgi:RNA polymerase sigma factor (sigma-70 family)
MKGCCGYWKTSNTGQFMQAYDEKDLLTRLAAGEVRAFNEIYFRYNTIIFNAAMVYVKDTPSARDIVQQVFVKIWEKRAVIPEVENFQDYIVVISRNLIIDQFRRKSSEVRKVAVFGEIKLKRQINNSSDLVEDHEYAHLLRSAIGGLPPQQKKIYLLINEERLSYKKTSVVLGLSKFTVKRHLELARRYVRDYINQYLER